MTDKQHEATPEAQATALAITRLLAAIPWPREPDLIQMEILGYLKAGVEAQDLDLVLDAVTDLRQSLPEMSRISIGGPSW